MAGKYGLTKTEYSLMQFFWQQEGPLMFADVVKYCNGECGHGWAVQTIHTHLTNLIKKDVLVSDRDGYKHSYAAKLTEEELKRNYACAVVQDVFGSSLKKILVALAPQSTCGKDELQEIHELIDQAFGKEE